MIYLIVIAVILICTALYLDTIKPKNYPPGPKWYPIDGCATVLKKYTRKYGGQHVALSKLTKRFKTNVLGLKLGKQLVVAIFSYEAVKHVLNSEDFLCRPDNFFIKLRSMGKIGIAGADGELWNSQKNFLLKHFRNLDVGQQKIQKLIQDELKTILFDIEMEGLYINIRTMLSPAVLSVLCGFLTDSPITTGNNDHLERILDLLEKRTKSFDVCGGILCKFPWIRFIMPELSGYKLVVELNKELKEFFRKVIDKHYRSWKEEKNDDFIHAFISEMKKDPTNSYFTENQLIMVCADILIAGAQTTTNTLDFAFLMMILHEDVQAKVHKELDAAYGKEEVIEYNSRTRVPYIEAVLMEVERLYYVTPILSRRVVEDVTLDGFIIPKETTVLVSSYSVFVDKKYWRDPAVFRPERFLDEQGLLTIPDRFIPFGLGKRCCLGENLAKSCVFSFFTGIMRDYIVSYPKNEPPPSDMPVPGINLAPEKYLAIFTKR